MSTDKIAGSWAEFYTPAPAAADRTPSRTRWRCDACGQPVDLAAAREHYDQCPGGDRECTICGAPMPTVGDLCAACQPVLLPRGTSTPRAR